VLAMFLKTSLFCSVGGRYFEYYLCMGLDIGAEEYVWLKAVVRYLGTIATDHEAVYIVVLWQ
jgi:hypothetical protein